MNHTWGGAQTNLETALKKTLMIISAKSELISWMTSNFEVEIQARSMDNVIECELFCCNSSGHSTVQYKIFFCILKELIDF